MSISKDDYEKALNVVHTYQEEQKYLSKFSGKSICPFCSGSKIVPLIGIANGHQDCKECDNGGMISNRKLAELQLEDLIEK